MNINKQTPYKAYLKLLRKLPNFKEKNIAIKSGPLKGYKWNLASRNNAFFIGDHEEDQIKFILDNLDDNGCFYDIGANAGYYSIAASLKLKKENSIFAFEPMPHFVDMVNYHAKLNNVKNIEVFQYALSDKPGEVEFSNIEESSGNTYVQDSSLYKKSSNVIKVKTIGLDDFLESTPGAKPPTIIKLDAEGAEYDVLKGAKNMLLKYKPLMLLSTHDRHLPGVKKRCLDFLSELGFEYEEQDLGLKESGLEDFIVRPTIKQTT